MAEKYNQEVNQVHPLAPSTVPRSDEEYSGTNNYRAQEQMKKNKRMKCFAYIACFAVFQVIIILILALTVMRVKSPKLRLGDITVTNDDVSGNVRLTARVLVKNTNFGRYKFDSGLATIRSGASNVGQFVIPESRARARSTKKMYVTVDLNSSNSSNNSMGGIWTLNVESQLRGKVELLKVVKKKKSAYMNCTVVVNLRSSTIQDSRCK
ncbi:hypothetical protein ABFS83_05G110700 [Erythranthe nasuta]